VNLVNVPEAVCLVFLIADEKVAASTLAASIVGKNAKDGVPAPNRTGTEERKVGLPKTELVKGWFVKGYLAVPRGAGGEIAVEVAREKTGDRSSDERHGVDEAYDTSDCFSWYGARVLEAGFDGSIELVLLDCRQAELAKERVNDEA
jgi:hypothetical protein